LGSTNLYDADLLLLEPNYTRRAVAAEWLREKGYNPDDILLFDNEGISPDERKRRDANALDVSLRLWAKWADPEVEIPDDAHGKDLLLHVDRVMFETGQPVPTYGKQTLYDGRTSEPFDQSVTVG